MLNGSAQHHRLSGLQKRRWQRMWIDARNFGNLPVDFHFVMRIYRQLVEGNRKPKRKEPLTDSGPFMTLESQNL